MKNTGLCPKCGAGDEQIVRISGWLGADKNVVQAGWLHRVAVTRLACTSCGYSEEWIDDPEDLACLRRKHPTLREENERRAAASAYAPPSGLFESALPPVKRCDKCQAPLVNFGHGLTCPICSLDQK